MARPPRRSGAKKPFSDSRKAWVRLGGTEFILYDLSDIKHQPEGVEFEGHSILIRLEGRGGYRKIHLGPFTADEVKALKQFWDYVFEQAIPLAEKLDDEARLEWEEHGIDYPRLYRVPPQFVVRERIQREHDTGVSSGSGGVDEVDGGSAAPDG